MLPHAALLLVLALALPAAAAPIVREDALAAIGQHDLLSNVLNQTEQPVLFYPYDVARDPSVGATRLYVADTFNSRVLGFECGAPGCSPATYAPAARVFGQRVFTTYQTNGGLRGSIGAGTLAFPRGVAVATDGSLYVADGDNNRVLVYLDPWTDSTADVVVGQPTMGSSTAGGGLGELRAPEGVFVAPSGELWVADTGNDRVLRFPLVATGAAADLVIGGSGPPGRTTLSRPRDLEVDAAGSLYVADTGNSRVLVFAPPFASGEAAIRVFGHDGSFTAGDPNDGGLDASSLAFPEKLRIDAGGRLWVGDTANNRVLRYDFPTLSQSATTVYGQSTTAEQPTFFTNLHDAPDGLPNAAGMWGPRGLDFDAAGTLWIADRDNSRLLGFESPLAVGPGFNVADRLLGKRFFVEAFANLPTATRVNNPTGIAVDGSVSPNRLWLVDIGNNRVLGYDSTADIGHDRPADVVIGQPDFTSGATNRNLNGPLQTTLDSRAGPDSLFFPDGAAVDRLGALYVADTSNSRVVRFDDPFATDGVADQVLGQDDFEARLPHAPFGDERSLAGATGVSVDADGNLWVADTLDHRVVRFPDVRGLAATGGEADLLLGQSAFVSGLSFPPYSPACAANRMRIPYAVSAAPSGRLYVADAGNHRVLVFAPPFVNGMNAFAVIGQADLTSCAANRGGAPGPGTLSGPRAAFEDADGNLLVADYGNNRVLVFHTPFAPTGDLVADEVIGQPDFTTVTLATPAPDTLSSPSGIAMDRDARLFIADRENSRVTRYATRTGPIVLLDPLPAPIVVGERLVLSGSGFTPGSVLKLYVATATGVAPYGPFTPLAQGAGALFIDLPPTIALGNGFATAQVVNTDEGFLESNPQSQLLYGSAAWNIPSLFTIDDVPIAAPDPSVPLAHVDTQVRAGATVTLGGNGFDAPLVNLFTAAGNVGPLAPLPGGGGAEIEVVVPASAPTGPGSFQIVNQPFEGNVASNAVSVVIGDLVSVSAVGQSGAGVTVDGTGFSSLTVINLFNDTGSGVANLGGLDPAGSARIPLTFVSDRRFTFVVPSGAAFGPAFVEALNPPFIPFSSSGTAPGGAFTILP